MNLRTSVRKTLNVACGLTLAFALLSCQNESTGVNVTPPPAPPPPPPPPPPPGVTEPGNLTVIGQGPVNDRFTAELWVQGTTAYTSTWGTRSVGSAQNRGNAIKIWDVSGNTPTLVDSVIVANASTLGDVQVTDDGKYLTVATEPSPNGALVIYDLANPRKPQLLTRFNNAETNPGVHTAEIQSVNGRLYAFLCIDPSGSLAARLVIIDITDPLAPSTVFSRAMGNPFVHDVFVRDGILMTAVWNDGIAIYDIGGGGKGGTVANPVLIGSTTIVGGKAHNIFWYRDPSNGSKRFAFVGEEGPGSIGSSSIGDIHVIDLSDFTKPPHEVGFFKVAGAGVHNFSVDETNGILYAAYYNGGVHALNIRGDLSSCETSQKSTDGRCDMTLMNREVARGPSGVASPVYVWGVHYTNGRLYASDMINGLWRLSTAPPP